MDNPVAISTKTTLFFCPYPGNPCAVRKYRPLLMREMNLRLPGLCLRRLRLNRHRKEVDATEPHSHRFAQILCYLNGRGVSVVGKTRTVVGPGTAVCIPPRIVHSFQEGSGRPPLCLVMDFEWRGISREGVKIVHLPQSHLGEMRQKLLALGSLPDPSASHARLVAAATALQVLDLLLADFGLIESRQRPSSPLVTQLEKLLRNREAEDWPVSRIASAMGYSGDYLNRAVRSASGLTLREYRDQLRLNKARTLLRRGLLIGEVAGEVGFSDQNYFARWFKKMTARSPSAFANEGVDSAPSQLAAEFTQSRQTDAGS